MQALLKTRQRWCTLVALAIVLVGTEASGTTPLFDQFLHQGKLVDLHQAKKGWLDLPWSKEVQTLRTRHCSAIGGPRGKYRIEEERLWLTGLHTCGGDVSLEVAYGKSEPVLADWVTGELLFDTGKTLCIPRSYPGYSIYETKVAVQVSSGVVLSIREESNANRPEVPSVSTSGSTPPPCNELVRNR